MSETTNHKPFTSGHELDALIAVKVMGWTKAVPTSHIEGDNLRLPDGSEPSYGESPEGRLYAIIPAYSARIEAAWQVVEKLLATGLEVDLFSEPGQRPGWAVKTNRPDEEFCQIVTAPTAPLAICRAALAAIESEAR